MTYFFIYKCFNIQTKNLLNIDEIFIFTFLKKALIGWMKKQQCLINLHLIQSSSKSEKFCGHRPKFLLTVHYLSEKQRIQIIQIWFLLPVLLRKLREQLLLRKL